MEAKISNGSITLSVTSKVQFRIVLFRFSIISFFLSVTIAIGTVSYLVIKEKETCIANRLYESTATAISVGLNTKVKGFLTVGGFINNLNEFTSNDEFNNSAPNITISGFESLVGSLRDDLGASAISFTPLVYNKTRSFWEKYAYHHLIDLEGPDNIQQLVNHGIFEYSKSGTRISDDGIFPNSIYPQVLTPIWQITPIMDLYSEIMYDYHSHQSLYKVVDEVISSQSPQFSELLDKFPSDDTTNSGPKTILFSPVTDTSKHTTVGLVATWINWESVFQSLSSTDLDGLDCVISSTTNSYTFSYENGKVDNKGQGDHHDHSYSYLQRDLSESLLSTNNLKSFGYSVQLYPNRHFFKSFRTNTPIIVCIAFVIPLMCGALLVYFYDQFMNKQFHQAMKSLAASTQLSNNLLHELEMKKTFVRYIAHEVRTPMNTVRMGLEVLDREIQNTTDFKQVPLLLTVEEVQKSCETALEVLNDFLLFDKIVSDSLVLEKSFVNIYHFVQEAVAPFFVQARQKDVSLDIINELSSTDSNVNSHNIYIDKHKFAQVIRNLVSNALKFTPAGGHVAIKLWQISSPTQRTMNARRMSVYKVRSQRFVIEVIDDGAGISKENQKKLFKNIVQFHANELQNGGGSGLGMYISFKIIQQHGGELYCISDGEGSGANFTIQIPAAESEESSPQIELRMIPSQKISFVESLYEPDGDSDTSSINIVRPKRSHSVHETSKVSRPGKASPISTSMMSSKFNAVTPVPIYSSKELPNANKVRDKIRRILIVDDTVSNRKMFARLLQNTFTTYVCEEAVDGIEAIEKIKSQMDGVHDWGGESGRVGSVYDVIVIDYLMPKMIGPEVVKIIRSMGYTGLIIGATGYMGEEERKLFLSSGADEVLSKPLNLVTFSSTIDRLMDTSFICSQL